MSNKTYYRASELRSKVLAKVKTGFERGFDSGFLACKDLVSFKAGYTTMIYGAPHSGKSQIAIEWLVYLSKRFGHVNYLYVPEAGEQDDAIVDILQTYLQKSLVNNGIDLSIDEIESAFAFLDKHFIFSDYKKKKSLKDIYEDIKNNKEDMGVINNVLIDHFGWVKRGEDQKGMMLNEYVCDYYQKTYLSSQSLKLHTITVNHISQINVKESKEGIRYLPIPTPQEIKGGLENYNNAYQLCSVWRPKKGLLDADGYEYPHNLVKITVDKSKPKGVGKMGEFDLYFDSSKQCYYEKVATGDQYIGDHDRLTYKPQTIQPSKHFNDIERHEESPF